MFSVDVPSPLSVIVSVTLFVQSPYDADGSPVAGGGDARRDAKAGQSAHGHSEKHDLLQSSSLSLSLANGGGSWRDSPARSSLD